MMLLDLPGSTAEASLARLDQFHFSENVTLSSLGESLTSVWLHGPLGGTVLERVLEGATGLSTWHDYQHLPVAFGDHAVVVARIDQLGVPGFCAFLPPAQEAAFRLALVSAGAVAASPDALEATRIDVGYPLFGLDMDEETIPLEAGIEGRAISMTKGCYVGQEVIVRVLHRGHGRVAKKLVRLAIDGPAPQSGAPLVSGDREVGRLTSVGVSPAEGVVALGYVRRDALESDAALTVNGTPVRQRR
jgi:folate-binding protein YgfZ